MSSIKGPPRSSSPTYVGRLSNDIRGYVSMYDHFLGKGIIVASDGSRYKLMRQHLLSYDSVGAYERVVFQRDLKGTGDVAMNVRRIKW